MRKQLIKALVPLLIGCFMLLGDFLTPAYAWVDYQTNTAVSEYYVFTKDERATPLNSMPDYTSWNNALTYSADYGNGISNIKVNYKGKYWMQGQSGSSYYHTFVAYTPYRSVSLCCAFDVTVYYKDGTSNTYSYDFLDSGSANIPGYNANGSIASSFEIKRKGSEYGKVWNSFGGGWILNTRGSVSTGGDFFAGGTNYLSLSYVQAGQFSDQTSVYQARDAANAANTAAQQAKTSADNASVRAWYAGTYGGVPESVADVAGYIANNQLPTIDTKIDGLQSSITNIQNNMGSDSSPPVVSIRTVSGAWGTTGSTIRAVVNASDNVSTAFEYSLDGTVYQPLPNDGVVVLPVSSPGSNLITVWVRDEAGNVGRNSITIRKL